VGVDLKEMHDLGRGDAVLQSPLHAVTRQHSHGQMWQLVHLRIKEAKQYPKSRLKIAVCHFDVFNIYLFCF
jgi:hypothetical protein